MTGYFVRINRRGRWKSVEIDKMTDQELATFFDQDEEDSRVWAIALVKWIRDNVAENIFKEA